MWRIEVPENYWREACMLYFLFGDDQHAGFVKQGIDFVPACAQGCLGQIRESAAVHGAQRLQSSGGTGQCDAGM